MKPLRILYVNTMDHGGGVAQLAFNLMAGCNAATKIAIGLMETMAWRALPRIVGPNALYRIPRQSVLVKSA